MKKTTIVTITILALFFSFLPRSAAFAKGDSGTLKIRNGSGGAVSMVLTDANGNQHVFTFGEGQSTKELPEGQYTYYLTMPCGNQAGTFGLTGVRQFYFSCSEGVVFEVSNPNTGPLPASSGLPAQYCYSVWDYPTNNFEYNWMNYGPHCQDIPAQPGDQIPNQYAPGEWDKVTFSNSGPALDQCIPEYGPAYYFAKCHWDD